VHAGAVELEAVGEAHLVAEVEEVGAVEEGKRKRRPWTTMGWGTSMVVLILGTYTWLL
jgi:hypothetical protein